MTASRPRRRGESANTAVRPGLRTRQADRAARRRPHRPSTSASTASDLVAGQGCGTGNIPLSRLAGGHDAQIACVDSRGKHRCAAASDHGRQDDDSCPVPVGGSQLMASVQLETVDRRRIRPKFARSKPDRSASSRTRLAGSITNTCAPSRCPGMGGSAQQMPTRRSSSRFSGKFNISPASPQCLGQA